MAAKQRGDRQLKGSVGQTTYKRTKDGFLAHQKAEGVGDKIRTHKNFQRVRENISEFSRAGLAARFLRDALRTQVQLSADVSATARLLTLMLKIVKSDPINDRGERRAMNGELALLENFDFNVLAPLNVVLQVPVNTTVNRITGLIKIEIPAFIAEQKLGVPKGADHFKINAAAVEINFDSGEFKGVKAFTQHLPWTNTETGAITLEMNMDAEIKNPLVLAMGVEYNQVVNGKYYPIYSKEFNGLRLVKVDRE